MQKGGYMIMKDLIRKGLSLGLGLAVVSREQIEKFVDEMVKKGEVTSSESKDLIRELLEKGEAEKREMNTRIHDQLAKLLQELNIPTKADLEQLEKRISDLENSVKDLDNR